MSEIEVYYARELFDKNANCQFSLNTNSVVLLSDHLVKVKLLEATLLRIRNSVAIASWNDKPEFKEWAKEMNKIINEAVTPKPSEG